MVWWSDSSGHVAKSLRTLYDQVNAAYPGRSTTDDGTIGDTSHQATTSDHNPDNGVVHALDITHDPARGFDSYAFADILRQNRDPRIRYVISNRRIMGDENYGRRNGVSAWTWQHYSGSNAHDRHVHVSVNYNAASEDTRPWNIGDGMVKPSAPSPSPDAPVSNRLAICLPRVLVHEGGNDDNPADPGGRTSRGIIQSEWDTWRQSHPGLPSDVWEAPQDQVEAIYRAKYWNAMLCDQLPCGLDYAVFDFGVNSGIKRAAEFLQAIVGAKVDGYFGPETIGKAMAADPTNVVNTLCDNRMAYLQGLPIWGTFHNGWTTRVKEVRADALADVARGGALPQGNSGPQPPATMPDTTTQQQFNDAVAQVQSAIADVKAGVVALGARVAALEAHPAAGAIAQTDWSPVIAALKPVTDAAAKELKAQLPNLMRKLAPNAIEILVSWITGRAPWAMVQTAAAAPPVAQTKANIITPLAVGTGAGGVGAVIVTALIEAFKQAK